MNFRALLLTLTLPALCASTWAQPTGNTKPPAPKASATTPAASAPAGFRTHKITDFCTHAPRNEWFDEEEMKLLAQHRGYRIKTFKVSKTNCYEVYGFDKENHVVEAYFDPITTKLLLRNEVK